MTTNRVRHVIVALLGVVTIGALASSYDGLRHVAELAQISFAWMIPVLIDGFGIIMSLIVWDARRNHRTAPAARALFYAATLTSIVCQVAAAPGPAADVSPVVAVILRALHGVPPALAALAFDRFLATYDPPAPVVPAPVEEPAVTRTRVTRAPGGKTGNPQVSELPPPPVPAPAPAATPAPVPVAAPGHDPYTTLPPALQHPARVADDMVRAGQPLSGGTLAKKLGRDESTCRGYLREIRKARDGSTKDDPWPLPAEPTAAPVA